MLSMLSFGTVFLVTRGAYQKKSRFVITMLKSGKNFWAPQVERKILDMLSEFGSGLKPLVLNDEGRENMEWRGSCYGD